MISRTHEPLPFKRLMAFFTAISSLHVFVFGCFFSSFCSEEISADPAAPTVTSAPKVSQTPTPAPANSAVMVQAAKVSEKNPVPSEKNSPKTTPATVDTGPKSPKLFRGVPMYFDMVGDGVTLDPLRLQYDLSDPGNLKMGGQELNLKTFYAMLLTGKDIQDVLPPTARGILNPREQATSYFVLKWPQPLIPEGGQIEVISKVGQTLWTLGLGTKDTLKWRTWTADLRKKYNERSLKSPLDDANKDKVDEILSAGIVWPIYANPLQGILSRQVEPFRICISKFDKGLYSRMCTPSYETFNDNGKMRIRMAARVASQAHVLVNGTAAATTDSHEIKPGEPIQFFAELENGINYEFVAKPQVPKIVDMIFNDAMDSVLVTGFDVPPTDDFTIITRKVIPKWVETFKWQETIGDLRVFWTSAFPYKNSEMHFSGVGGGAFLQKMKIEKMPKQSDRVFAHSKNIKGTYIDGAELKGNRSAKQTVQTTENSMQFDPDGLHFTWNYKALERGEYNRAYLRVFDHDTYFRAYQEVFKGYPREIGFRSSGIVSSEGKTVLVGELAFQYWFEDIFGWTDYNLAHQRWGISAKYFQTIGKFAIGKISETLTDETIDLKYRFTPGLWNRDESWGAVLGEQSLSYYIFNKRMLGAGVFWARSLPRLFDEVLDNFWLHGFPKWVDAQFVTYLIPGDSVTRIHVPTYSLDFHGKIMWTDSFFAEAGFGIKQYNIDDLNRELNLRFSTLYATVGLGFNF